MNTCVCTMITSWFLVRIESDFHTKLPGSGESINLRYQVFEPASLIQFRQIGFYRSSSSFQASIRTEIFQSISKESQFKSSTVSIQNLHDRINNFQQLTSQTRCREIRLLQQNLLLTQYPTVLGIWDKELYITAFSLFFWYC